MTLLATTFVAASTPAIPGWLQFIVFVGCALASLMVFVASRPEMQEGTALRCIVASCVVFVVAIAFSSLTVLHAAVIYCDTKYYWWDVFGWIC